MKLASKDQIVEELIETYENSKVKGIPEDERFWEGYLEALKWVLGFTPHHEREEEDLPFKPEPIPNTENG